MLNLRKAKRKMNKRVMNQMDLNEGYLHSFKVRAMDALEVVETRQRRTEVMLEKLLQQSNIQIPPLVQAGPNGVLNSDEMEEKLKSVVLSMKSRSGSTISVTSESKECK